MISDISSIKVSSDGKRKVTAKDLFATDTKRKPEALVSSNEDFFDELNGVTRIKSNESMENKAIFSSMPEDAVMTYK